MIVSKHFELISNAAWRRPRVYQQAARVSPRMFLNISSGNFIDVASFTVINFVNFNRRHSRRELE